MLGQYSTPSDVADALAAWALDGAPARRLRVLEPSAGDGVLVRSLACAARSREQGIDHVRVVELDPDVASAIDVGDHLGDATVEVLEGDWFAAPRGDRFDVVVGNPPWVRNHIGRDHHPRLAEVEQAWGLSLPATTNTSTWFLLDALTVLADDGCLVFLLPTDIMDAAHTAPVRRLLTSGRWHVDAVRITDDDGIFEDVRSTAMVLRVRPCVDGSARIRCGAASRDALARPGEVGWTLDAPCDGVDAESRWMSRSATESPAGQLTIGDVARCSRGIATGANAWFTLTREDALRHRLPDSVLVPVIARAAQAPGTTLDHAVHGAAEAAGGRTLLVAATRDPHDEAVRRYIELGEQAGVPQRHLARARTTWYDVEVHEPAPLLVGTFSRDGVRAVWNDARIATLTCFHRVVPAATTGDAETRLLWLLLASGWLDGEADLQARTLGGGLRKLEPGDVERMRIPELGAIIAARAAEVDALAGMLASTAALDAATRRTLRSRLDALVGPSSAHRPAR